MERGAWWAAVQGVAKSQTRLSDFTFTFHFPALEKEMATHSSSCLENPRDGGASWAAVYRVTQSRTRLKRLSSSSSSTWNNMVKNVDFLPLQPDSNSVADNGKERGFLRKKPCWSSLSSQECITSCLPPQDPHQPAPWRQEKRWIRHQREGEQAWPVLPNKTAIPGNKSFSWGQDTHLTVLTTKQGFPGSLV